MQKYRKFFFFNEHVYYIKYQQDITTINKKNTTNWHFYSTAKTFLNYRQNWKTLFYVYTYIYINIKKIQIFTLIFNMTFLIPHFVRLTPNHQRLRNLLMCLIFKITIWHINTSVEKEQRSKGPKGWGRPPLEPCLQTRQRVDISKIFDIGKTLTNAHMRKSLITSDSCKINTYISGIISWYCLPWK